MSAIVRAVKSTRLSDLGRRFRLVTESCFDTGFSCLYLEGLCAKIHSRLEAAVQNGLFCTGVLGRQRGSNPSLAGRIGLMMLLR
jgi:hypothetical protein